MNTYVLFLSSQPRGWLRQVELANFALQSEQREKNGKRQTQKKNLNSILQLIFNHMWFPSTSRVVPWPPQDYALTFWTSFSLSLSFATFFSILFPLFPSPSSYTFIPFSDSFFPSTYFPASVLRIAFSSIISSDPYSHIPSLIALQQQCPDTEKGICSYKNNTAAAPAYLVKALSIWQEQLANPWGRGNILY